MRSVDHTCDPARIGPKGAGPFYTSQLGARHGRIVSPLRILVVEDNMLMGLQIAQDLELLGHHAVGPFTSLEAAQDAIDHIDAAILDVRIGREDSFALARNLKSLSQPVVFYTGLSVFNLPPELIYIPVVSKPAPVRHLVDQLAEGLRPRSTAELILDALPHLRQRAREIHRDPSSADELVEAALTAALHIVDEIPREQIYTWLLRFIENMRHPLAS